MCGIIKRGMVAQMKNVQVAITTKELTYTHLQDIKTAIKIDIQFA